MSRRHYLICYDVADDKRRDRVFQVLQDNGDHTQFSVFLCQLNEADLAHVQAALTPIVHATEDQVLIVDLGNVRHDRELGIQTIGRGYAPPKRTMIV